MNGNQTSLPNVSLSSLFHLKSSRASKSFIMKKKLFNELWNRVHIIYWVYPRICFWNDRNVFSFSSDFYGQFSANKKKNFTVAAGQKEKISRLPEIHRFAWEPLINIRSCVKFKTISIISCTLQSNFEEERWVNKTFLSIPLLLMIFISAHPNKSFFIITTLWEIPCKGLFVYQKVLKETLDLWKILSSTQESTDFTLCDIRKRKKSPKK